MELLKNVWDGIYMFSVFQIQLSFIKVLPGSGIPNTASVPLPQHTSDLLPHTLQILPSKHLGTLFLVRSSQC